MFEKECGIKSNSNFIEFKSYCGGWVDPEYKPTYTKIDVSDNCIGNKVMETLAISRDLRDARYTSIYFRREHTEKRYNDYVKNLCEKFDYKTKNDAFKNMMSVSIVLKENKILSLSPWLHEKLEYWSEIDEPNLCILYNSPPEIIGAVVRYAFSRCKGKGPYAKGAEIVTKALFPDGVPNSLEEYLESIDPGYKKWLIYE